MIIWTFVAPDTTGFFFDLIPAGCRYRLRMLSLGAKNLGVGQSRPSSEISLKRATGSVFRVYDCGIVQVDFPIQAFG